MADFPSRLDLFAIGRDYVLQRAKKIDPAQVNILGSDVNIFVGASSHLAYALVLQLIFAVNRLLLDGAEGDDLDRYALDRYQLVRNGAAAALGSVDFSRQTAAVGAGSIPIGTSLKTLSGIEYITITTASFGASDLTTVANVRAAQAGNPSEAGANTIRQFTSLTTLFDQSLQVNNPLPTAGGEDAESDDDFRARIRDFWNTARRGTLGAIEFGAKTVPGIISAQALEALTPGHTPARVVNLYIADGSGVASAALGNSVTTALDEYRAAGIAVIVSTSIPQIVNVSLKLSFTAGVDTATLTDLITAAIVEFINSLPVNGTLLKASLAAVLSRFSNDGLIVNDSTLATPTGDLVPVLGSTLRTTLANVTVL